MHIFIPVLVVLGLWLMSRVPTAVRGNRLSIVAMVLAITVAIWNASQGSLIVAALFLLIGAIIGLQLSRKVTMIQMPQTVGLLNGLGGGASALVGIVSLMGIMNVDTFIERQSFSGFMLNSFESSTAVLAIIVGMLTLTGSLVAAGKLHKVLSQKPVVYKNHSMWVALLLILSLAIFVWGTWFINQASVNWIIISAVIVSALFGWLFAIRVGGADMPITISLLNSLSGVAGSIAGMAIGNIMLVAIGGIVGASGLLLTQIMCKAMNRSLLDILLGKTSAPAGAKKGTAPAAKMEAPKAEVKQTESLSDIMKAAKSVIIVPGYGMALAQAQHQVKQLGDAFTKNGAKVRYAIHPVAGRMPGHMNVLLAEADVDYEDLYEMEAINDDFKETDLVVVIGANDVLNPAARDAEGTPIYGMPVLNVDQAKHVVICNYDLKPGYAGVPNPLYEKSEGVTLKLGDAKESVTNIISELQSSDAIATPEDKGGDLGSIMKAAKSVIIVPGYGMALAQAQHQVKQLGDAFAKNGAKVRYAIHPVAGRMPGHMNVLLAEADVDYEDLYEMEAINDDFKETDLVVVIGANDVLNPAARDAEGTPIYDMPVLNVDQAKHVVICNYDLNPGYAGVPNPLYEKSEGVTLLLGDAKESLGTLLSEIQ